MHDNTQTLPIPLPLPLVVHKAMAPHTVLVVAAQLNSPPEFVVVKEVELSPQGPEEVPSAPPGL